MRPYYIMASVSSSNEYGDSNYEPAYVCACVNDGFRETVRNIVHLWPVLQEATKDRMVHVTIRLGVCWYEEGLEAHVMNPEDTLEAAKEGVVLSMRNPIPDRFDDEMSDFIRGDWMDIYCHGDGMGEVVFRSYDKHGDTEFSSGSISMDLILHDPESFVAIEWKPAEAPEVDA